MVDILGYIATIIVLISFTSSNIRTLRILSVVGSILFGIYGFILHATPVIVINSSVILINLYYLLLKKK